MNRRELFGAVAGLVVAPEPATSVPWAPWVTISTSALRRAGMTQAAAAAVLAAKARELEEAARALGRKA